MSVDVDTNFDCLLFVDLAKRNETNKEKKENIKVQETIKQIIHVRNVTFSVGVGSFFLQVSVPGAPVFPQGDTGKIGELLKFSVKT